MLSNIRSGWVGKVRRSGWLPEVREEEGSSKTVKSTRTTQGAKDRAASRARGLNDGAVYKWRRRHPDQAHLSGAEVAAIIVENKRRNGGV